MKKKVITLIVMILLIINAFSILAITEKEKTQILDFLINSDKTSYSVFLAFADEIGYDFTAEPEITAEIESKSKKYGVLLIPYDNIQGMDKVRIDSETLVILEQRQEEALRLAQESLKEEQISEIFTLWPVILILVVFIIVFAVLELYRRDKIGKIKKRKDKK